MEYWSVEKKEVNPLAITPTLRNYLGVVFNPQGVPYPKFV
jgi:hypothetical protein